MRELSDLYVSVREREEQSGRLPLREVASRWQLFCRRLHTRRQLLQLDARQLADIGLTSEQARKEATRPFWQLLR
ncbi:DUF1127 domain-containing protein [Aquipseudomonas guryensis]|uniref:DUF1127 domain-containing protein n=1 Tax=Aquipseudomonas guryensis TaxID=2759165 RepID=A0A7W4D9B9_9GAMM|nr:DUF1127 domain-containing protein [Pseudomonas guryensis]MBB1518401.1 DUF1127 domain-containing protein [Pseudomonas guryensis]